MKTWLPLSLLCIALTGCGSDQTTNGDVQLPSQQAQPGKYLFAAVFYNDAWVKTRRGFVIKGNGDLYYFDVSATTASLPDTETASETELTRYFEAAQFDFVQTIPPEQLNTFWQQGQTLRNSTLGTEQSICRDAGQYRYLMFQPVDQQQLRQTLIYQTGDFRREQQDTKAQVLKEFLLQQAVKLQIAYVLDPAGNNWCSGL